MNCLAASKTRAVRCLATQVASPDHVVPGKVALITGGNTGIGYQTAKGLAQKGYSIILGCRDEAKGKDAQRRLK